jgi:hypothetical protein
VNIGFIGVPKMPLEQLDLVCQIFEMVRPGKVIYFKDTPAGRQVSELSAGLKFESFGTAYLSDIVNTGEPMTIVIALDSVSPGWVDACFWLAVDLCNTHTIIVNDNGSYEYKGIWPIENRPIHLTITAEKQDKLGILRRLIGVETC